MEKISYELAKELKDAGFPQKESGTPHTRHVCEKHQYKYPTFSCGECDIVYAPTLSELIEACGGESVIILTVGKTMSTVLHGVTVLISEDKTPKIAIAQLYYG